MNVTCCPFCTWKTFERGVWKAHYAVRKHMQEVHPQDFKDMEHDEEGVRQEMRRLYRRYGDATLRRY